MSQSANAFVPIAAVIFLTLATWPAQADEVHVGDYGGIPNDGQCDLAAIRAAIVAAKSGGLTGTVRFDAGVYNTHEDNQIDGKHIAIEDISRLTLLGATDAQGEPATVIERNVAQMQNDLDVAQQLWIRNSHNIAIQNLAFDNQPAFATAGVVLSVDGAQDAVEVEVFAGLPHFDGMKCYSANAWDLQTRELTPVPPLTQGTVPSNFDADRWEAVDPEAQPRRYRISGYGFANLVNVGDGASWHFCVLGGGTLRATDNSYLTFDNVHFYNIKCAGTVSTNHNVTMREVEVKPIPPQLAVGSRDCFYMSRNTGDLLVEDCYVKGVRWDPFSVHTSFAVVADILSPRTIECTYVGSTWDVAGSGALTFWTGTTPADASVADGAYLGKVDDEYVYRVDLAEDLPPSVQIGSKFTAANQCFDQAVFRRSAFEGNCGRVILYEMDNVTVEDCLFRNNTYGGVCFGLSSNSGVGAFVRNGVIRNNVFEDMTWVNSTEGVYTGAVKLYGNGPFGDAPYNMNILIENNLFSGINYSPEFSPIDIQNAQNVTVRNNAYVDCTNTVRIDPNSTLNIVVDDPVFQADPNIVVASFNDMNLGGMRDAHGQPAGTGVGFLDDYWATGTSVVQVVAGDLAAPAGTGYSVVTGGAAQCVQGDHPSADRRQARRVDPVTGGGGEDIWISFLARNVEPTDVAGVDFIASTQYVVDPPGALARKIILAGTTLKVVAAGGGGGAVDVSGKVALGETALVLAKLNTNAAAEPEHISVWIDPNVADGPAGLPAPDFIQTGDLGWDMDGVAWLGLQTWDTGPSGVGGYVDNVRISNGANAFAFVVGLVAHGDCDGDDDVDWADLLELLNCLAGPDDNAGPGCACFDLNRDGAVDAADLAEFQRAFAGAL